MVTLCHRHHNARAHRNMTTNKRPANGYCLCVSVLRAAMRVPQYLFVKLPRAFVAFYNLLCRDGGKETRSYVYVHAYERVYVS